MGLSGTDQGGPATRLQPRLPSHGLHDFLSSAEARGGVGVGGSFWCWLSPGMHLKRGVWGGGGQKVRCGPATVLQPRLPYHGLHHLLNSIRVRLAIACPIGPSCCSLTSLGLGWRRGLLGSGLYRRVTLCYGLSLGRGVQGHRA